MQQCFPVAQLVSATTLIIPHHDALLFAGFPIIKEGIARIKKGAVLLVFENRHRFILTLRKHISMDAETLRNLQAPLKEKYREAPAAAMITLQASGQLGEGISCNVATGKAIVEAGLHPATGGTGMLACSGNLLLEALVACAGVTLSAVATAIGIVIKDGSIKAAGDLDFRGTLGVSKEAPVGFTNIRLCFTLDTDANAEQLASLAKLTERYCVVYQTLARGVPVTAEFSAYCQ